MGVTGIETVVVFGNSSAVGFNTGGRGYPIVLGELLGAKGLVAQTRFGKTTAEAYEEYRNVIGDLRPDVVVVGTIMSEVLVHPGRRVQKLLERVFPPTWHGVFGLERRAYYSPTRAEMLKQRITSESKTALKRLLVAITGGYNRMEPEESAKCMDQFFTELEAICPIVVSVGPFEIDDHYFPRQSRSRARFEVEYRRVLGKHPNVVSVDLDPVLNRWDHFFDDHAHWHAEGHAVVAAEIARRIREDYPQRGMDQVLRSTDISAWTTPATASISASDTDT